MVGGGLAGGKLIQTQQRSVFFTVLRGSEVIFRRNYIQTTDSSIAAYGLFLLLLRLR